MGDVKKLERPVLVKRSYAKEKYPSLRLIHLIRKKWTKLSEEQVACYNIDFPKFCDALKVIYGIPEEEIDRQLNLMEREVYYAA